MVVFFVTIDGREVPLDELEGPEYAEQRQLARGIERALQYLPCPNGHRPSLRVVVPQRSTNSFRTEGWCCDDYGSLGSLALRRISHTSLDRY